MRRFCLTTILVSAIAAQVPAGTTVPPVEQLLSEIIRVDTSNPPGNEGQLDRLLESKFKPLGFEIDLIETPQAGKGHFVARLKGDGTKRPILLAAHSDVVGVEREKWSLDPFGGIIKDGYVYGRGAIDFKGGLAVFAEAVMRLARNKIPLHRDVIVLHELQGFTTSVSLDEALHSLVHGPAQEGMTEGSARGRIAIGWGRQDKVTLPSQAARALRLFPEATLQWFDKCGHFPHWDQPVHAAQFILDSTR